MLLTPVSTLWKCTAQMAISCLSNFEDVVDGVARRCTGEVAVAHALLDGAGSGLSILGTGRRPA